jgi:hypothetical protein
MGLGGRKSQSSNTPRFVSSSSLWIPHFVRNDKKMAFSLGKLLVNCAGSRRGDELLKIHVQPANQPVTLNLKLFNGSPRLPLPQSPSL